jgi:putative transposase
MPRKARIDAPGALHHIIIRGIERRRIFSDDQDRDNFIERLGEIGVEFGDAHKKITFMITYIVL